MRYTLVLLTLALLPGCTFVGLVIDDRAGTDERGLFAEAGWEIDKAILQTALSCESDGRKRIKEDFDDIACPGDDVRQVCTTANGCRCEKTL